jgi:DNA repair photolyase
MQVVVNEVLTTLVSAGSQSATPPWAVLDVRARGTEFVRLPIASILNSPQQTGMRFWSLNPYVGCEFGCSYCYARYVHRYVVERARDRRIWPAATEPSGGCSDDEFLGLPGAGIGDGWEAFERRIFVKTDAPDVVGRTLRPSRFQDHGILIGTATDPYQPAERRFRLTRQVLERLAQFHGLRIGLITKSPLVARDVDVLRRLAERSDVTVHCSIITVDVPLVRKLEPRSPVPPLRLKALATLAKAGLRAGVMIAPVLPGITDDVPHLRALLRAAREAGAAFAGVSPLRLYPAIKPRFLPIVAREFPVLLPRYERAFDERGELSAAYSAALERRVERLSREVGFEEDGCTDAPAYRRTESTQWELPL